MREKIQTLKTALMECKARLKSSPGFQPLMSIEAQLEYLIDVAEGRNLDRSRLNEIIIGIYAAREFETRDMQFANLLYEVEEAVDVMKQG